MRLLTWSFVCLSAIAASSLFADDVDDLKKSDLPVDPKGLHEFFQRRSSEKSHTPLLPQGIGAAVRVLAASKNPDGLKALWACAVSESDLVERDEFCSALAADERRHAEPRLLLTELTSTNPAHAELAAYAVARYFEPRYRDDAIRASRAGAARGLLGPQFMKELREAQPAAKETLIKNGVAKADDFRPDHLETRQTLPGMEYLKRRIPTPLETAGIKTAVAKLGEADFKDREKATAQLCAAGEPAIPFLRELEYADDPEVRLRVRSCLKEIERQKIPDGTLAALRVIAWNASAASCNNALRHLLDYAPFVESKEVEDMLLPTIALICIRMGGVPAMLDDAARSNVPEQRAIAFWVRGKIDELVKGECPGCEDASPVVRLRSAQGLVFAEARQGVERLIRVLPEIEQRYLPEIDDVLSTLAGDAAPKGAIANSEPANRMKVRDAWLTWFAKTGASLDLASLRREKAYEGIITICENEVGIAKNGGSRVWQRGRDGRERWSVGNFQGAMSCDLLRNGNVLVAEPRKRRIVERNPSGVDVWEYQVTGGQVIKVKRLPNGNTFIATNNQFLEISSDKNIVHSHTLPAGTFMFSADRTDDGRVVCMSSRGAIIEYSADTENELRTIPFPAAMTGLATIHAFAKDRFLIALPNTNNGQVIEVDATGKTVWQANFKGAFRAIKLPTGNVVVGSHTDRRIAEIDRDGRIVWETKCQGQPTALLAR